MSQEIIEGIHMIEKEKGIEEGVLISALEDALLAAFKKTPEASRHAEVKLDEAEFRMVWLVIRLTAAGALMSASSFFEALTTTCSL